MMCRDDRWAGRERGIHFNNCLNMKVTSKAISQQLVMVTHNRLEDNHIHSPFNDIHGLDNDIHYLTYCLPTHTLLMYTVEF